MNKKGSYQYDLKLHGRKVCYATKSYDIETSEIGLNLY